MKSPLAYCIVAALFFGTWPLVARFAAIDNVGWLALLFSVGTGAMALFGINWQVPAQKPLLIGLLAGAVNGVGMLAFAALINWKGVDLSRTAPIVFVLMPVFTVLGALLLFGEPLTVRKGVGIGVGLIAIWLLS